jgi:hypothetical protein
LMAYISAWKIVGVVPRASWCLTEGPYIPIAVD